MKHVICFEYNDKGFVAQLDARLQMITVTVCLFVVLPFSNTVYQMNIHQSVYACINVKISVIMLHHGGQSPM